MFLVAGNTVLRPVTDASVEHLTWLFVGIKFKDIVRIKNKCYSL